MNFNSKVIFNSDSDGKFPNQCNIAISKDSFTYGNKVIPMEYVIGIRHTNPRISQTCCGSKSKLAFEAEFITSKSTGIWTVFHLEIRKAKNSTMRPPAFKRIVFSNEILQEAEAIVDAAQIALGYLADRRKLLFLANPFGGTNKAVKVYHDIVLPLLRIAGLEELHELTLTTHQNHATEIGNDLDYAKYRVAATISGDGVFHELLNGLMGRSDWKEASVLPIGCVSAGSSNAIGQNLDTADPTLATFAIIKGKSQKMDILAVIQNSSVMYTHLSLFWTIIADVDIESERFRKLGSLRMALMVVIRLIKFRSYRGKLYLLTADDAEKYKLPSSTKITYKGWFKLTSGPTARYISTNAENHQNWPLQIESNFQYFAAVNLPWIATDYQACPFAKLNNGLLDVLFCEKLSRGAVLSSFLDAERGVSMTLPKIQHHRVKALVLEPGGYGPVPEDKSSQMELLEGNLEKLILDVSGERVPYGTIKVEVIPGVLNCIVPSWFDEGKWERNFRSDFPNFKS